MAESSTTNPELDYAAALKQVQSRTPKENFMVIELSYNAKLVLPYKDGLAFMAALSRAEMYSDPYSDPHTISPYKSDAVKTWVMSHVDYENIKMGQLLGISHKDVANMRAAVESIKKAETKP